MPLTTSCQSGTHMFHQPPCCWQSSIFNSPPSLWCLSLPSTRTLRDYTHYNNATTGFSIATDKELLALVKDYQPWQKMVSVVIDEMYICEGILLALYMRRVAVTTLLWLHREVLRRLTTKCLSIATCHSVISTPTPLQLGVGV